MTESEQQCEYRTVSYLVSAIANICAASPNKIIDRLTGFLWDEEEGNLIKMANVSTLQTDKTHQRQDEAIKRENRMHNEMREVVTKVKKAGGRYITEADALVYGYVWMALKMADGSIENARRIYADITGESVPSRPFIKNKREKMRCYGVL